MNTDNVINNPLQISTDNVINKELEKFRKNLKKPGIAIIGQAGVGKSALIRAVFGTDTNIDMPKSQAGPCQTTEFRQYSDTTKPVRLYDSPGYAVGYETEEIQEFLVKIREELEKRQLQTTDSPKLNYYDDIIHLIWYVINARYQKFDIKVIEEFIKLGFPLIIVINKQDTIDPEDLNKLKNQLTEDLNELKNRLEMSLGLDKINIQILEVAAKPYLDPELPESYLAGKRSEYKAKLLKLVDKSIELLPETYHNAFIYSQIIDIKKKKTLAWMFIGASASAVLAAAFTPLPGTTPIATLSVQDRLIKELESLYGLPEEYLVLMRREINLLEERTTVLIAGLVCDLGGITIGMLFPPIFFTAEAIAGGIAATYILVLSLAYTKTLETTSLQILNATKTKNKAEIIDFMKKEFKKNFDKYSSMSGKGTPDIEKIGEEFLQES